MEASLRWQNQGVVEIFHNSFLFNGPFPHDDDQIGHGKGLALVKEM